VRRLCNNVSLVLAAALLRGNGRADIVIKLIAVLVSVTLVLRGRNPETRLPVVEGLVLAAQVNGITVTGLVTAALRKRARALRQLGGDGGVLGDPVGEGILAILNDAVVCQC
jgi:hypothetical protein